jgi:hypothetical protein
MKVNGSRATVPLQLNIPEDERTVFQVKAASRGEGVDHPVSGGAKEPGEDKGFWCK